MNKLFVVGIGSGNVEDMTLKAISLLHESEVIFGDELSVKLLSKYFGVNKFVVNEYSKTEERCKMAIEMANKGYKVSIIGSGDTGVYGIAGIILDLIGDNITLDVEIVCGVTFAISGAALLGAPIIQDFAVISLSDNISETDKIIDRVKCASKADFSIVFYSPCNKTHKNIKIVKKLLLGLKNEMTPVGIVKNIGRDGEKVTITNIRDMKIDSIDMFTILFIGNNRTYVKNGKIISPIV